MGSQTVLTRADDGVKSTLPRYGAWRHEKGMRKPGVVEVSDDLEGLMRKYEVPPERVFTIQRGDGSK